MKFGRIAGTTAIVAVAAGAGVLISNGASATPPPPTPITLNLLGMASAACPLLNGTMAVAPGTTVQFGTDVLLGALSTESVTIKPAPDSADPKSSKTIDPMSATNTKVAFAKAATYQLSWRTKSLVGLLSTTQTGKLVINKDAQKCVVAIQVPVPSVSVPGVPGSVTSPINGIIGGVASAVNSAVGPVNSAVGPILGGVNGTVGGITGGLPGSSNPVAGTPPSGSSPGTIYKPTGPTVADRTVPKGYGNGSGLGGVFVGGVGNSINAPALGFVGTGKAGSGSSGAAVKSGGSPNTVELAANKPRSALDSWSTVIVVLAMIALSGATAFYARTFLLHPVAARTKS